MYHKISNIASADQIERTFRIPFNYPHIYNPQPMINGFSEATIPMICMEQPNHISFGIWGMLPVGYEDDWAEFQETINTLSVSVDEIKHNEMYLDSILNRRCLFIVTGYFSTFLYKGEVYPFYVHDENQEPFCVAGIYNQLEDGFYTCSLLLKTADSFHKKINNLGNLMPVIINPDDFNLWLNRDAAEEEFEHLLSEDNNASMHLRAYPIAKELFKKDISYESMLERTHYEGIPDTILK